MTMSETAEPTITTTYEMPFDRFYEDIHDEVVRHFTGRRDRIELVEIVPPTELVSSAPAERRGEIYAIVEDFGRFLSNRADAGETPLTTLPVNGEPGKILLALRP